MTKDELAEKLCNNADARQIARQQDAARFHESHRDVQQYWRVIATAAIDAMNQCSSGTATPRKRPWCEWCGAEMAEVLCPTCTKWWAENPPEPPLPASPANDGA